MKIAFTWVDFILFLWNSNKDLLVCIQKHAKLQAQKAPGRNHYTPSMLMPRKIGSGIECSSNSSSCPHWPRNYYLRIKLEGSTVSSNSTWVS